MTDDTLREAVDSEEFYDLCQLYRMAPISDQAVVIARFEAIQAWVLAFARAQQAKGLREAAILAVNGHFLHDQSPDYLVAKALAKMLKAQATAREQA